MNILLGWYDVLLKAKFDVLLKAKQSKNKTKAKTKPSKTKKQRKCGMEGSIYGIHIAIHAFLYTLPFC